MHDTPIRVDHVGIAVETITAAEPVLAALGGERLIVEPGPDETFRWASYRLGDASRLELVEPLTEDSTIRTYLDTHGEGLHHVTLEVADIDAVTTAIEAAGYTVVEEATHDGWREAFVSPQNPTGVLFQLMEYQPGYGDDRGNPSALYVDGTPLGGQA